jgi:hypothetical protein
LDTVTRMRLGGYMIWRAVFDYGVDRKDNLPLGFSFSLVWQAGKSKANVLYEGDG